MKRSKTTTQISPSLSARLNAYALAASGVGVGLLAIAAPADAEVVYTPAHVVLSGSRDYDLDVNNDGRYDFAFHIGNSSANGTLTVQNFSGGNIIDSTDGVEFGRSTSFPLALKRGAPIGSKKRFAGCYAFCYEIMASAPQSREGGNWINVTNRYLGLKFLAGKEKYYGWARLNVRVNGLQVTAELTGYAYENIPNDPIHAGQTSGTFDEPVYGEESANPEALNAPQTEKSTPPSPQPATLGMLALGAPGLPHRLREASLH